MSHLILVELFDRRADQQAAAGLVVIQSVAGVGALRQLRRLPAEYEGTITHAVTDRGR